MALLRSEEPRDFFQKGSLANIGVPCLDEKRYVIFAVHPNIAPLQFSEDTLNRNELGAFATHQTWTSQS